MERKKVPLFCLMVNWRSESGREQAIRNFFAQRGLSTAQDYLAGNGAVPDATRLLSYALPCDLQFITTITKDVLGEIYHVKEQDGLNFTYQEHYNAL